MNKFIRDIMPLFLLFAISVSVIIFLSNPPEIAGYLHPEVYYTETQEGDKVCHEVQAGDPETRKLVTIPCAELSEEQLRELMENKKVKRFLHVPLPKPDYLVVQ